MGIAFIWPGFKWKKGIDWSIKSEFYHKNTTINKTTNKQNEKKNLYILFSIRWTSLGIILKFFLNFSEVFIFLLIVIN